MSNPGPLPGPPGDLGRRKVTLIEFDALIFRSHRIDRDPVFFGRSRQNRFDSPDATFGVMYAGRDAFCAFIERFARSAGTRVVTTTALSEHALSELKPTRPLKLIDLTQSGTLTRIGADSRLFSAEYEVSQLWSVALRAHPAQADGLIYPSRMDPARHALALFEGRTPKFLTFRRQSWYAAGQQRQVLAEIVEHYGLELIESRFVAPRKRGGGQRQFGLFAEDPGEV